MEYKEPKNKYGVETGEIFVRDRGEDAGTRYLFYQVVALHGEYTVTLRGISTMSVAFDGFCKQVVPIPNAWLTDKDFATPHIRVFSVFDKVWDGLDERNKKVQLDNGRPYIKICESCGGKAYLQKSTDTYIELEGERDYPFFLRESAPELAKQLDLKNGSGIFFTLVTDESGSKKRCTVIRYPDGREEEVDLKELFRDHLKTRKLRSQNNGGKI